MILLFILTLTGQIIGWTERAYPEELLYSIEDQFRGMIKNRK
jgi:uncharacterized membrane protein SpoIIM required for sporulation